MKKIVFFAFFFKLLPKFSDLKYSDDCIGKITSKSFRLKPVFIQKWYECIKITSSLEGRIHAISPHQCDGWIRDHHSGVKTYQLIRQLQRSYTHFYLDDDFYRGTPLLRNAIGHLHRIYTSTMYFNWGTPLVTVFFTK